MKKVICTISIVFAIAVFIIITKIEITVNNADTAVIYLSDSYPIYLEVDRIKVMFNGSYKIESVDGTIYIADSSKVVFIQSVDD